VIRREDAQYGLTLATCYFGFAAVVSLLSGDWKWLVLSLIVGLVVLPLILLCGAVIHRFFGWLLRVDR
jgi:ABC-type multidrug transport system permease subunit